MTDFAYAGQELEQARHATNWKAYFGARVAKYVRGRVLEVGAGLGGTTVHLLTGSQTEWVCLEPDAALARELSATLAANSSPVSTRVVVGDISALDPAERFDCILYIDVLEHIEDDTGELARAARFLAKGGGLVVLCPAFQVLFSAMDTALGHFRRYTARTLVAVFPPELRRSEVFYLDSLGMVASLANKFVLRQDAPGAGQVKFWDGFIIPISRVFDRLVAYSAGRSVIAVFSKPNDV
jgi:SAM-dependent methyltransferase